MADRGGPVPCQAWPTDCPVITGTLDKPAHRSNREIAGSPDISQGRINLLPDGNEDGGARYGAVSAYYQKAPHESIHGHLLSWSSCVTSRSFGVKHHWMSLSRISPTTGTDRGGMHDAATSRTQRVRRDALSCSCAVDAPLVCVREQKGCWTTARTEQINR